MGCITRGQGQEGSRRYSEEMRTEVGNGGGETEAGAGMGAETGTKTGTGTGKRTERRAAAGRETNK